MMKKTEKGVENELEEIERAQEPPTPKEPAPAEPEKKAEPEKRGNEIMNKKSIFAKMDMAKRNEMFERDDVKAFLTEIRSAMKEQRAITGGELVWVMNETTYTKLKAESLSINAAGAVVAGIEGTMPVAGGVVEVLDFMPDNTIIGGYFDLYLFAEMERGAKKGRELYWRSGRKEAKEK